MCWLRYAHEHGGPWDEVTCERAAEGGQHHLEVLRYAHEQGCPWDEGTSALLGCVSGELSSDAYLCTCEAASSRPRSGAAAGPRRARRAGPRGAKPIGRERAPLDPVAHPGPHSAALAEALCRGRSY